jgi:hypothetical protein
VNPIHFMTSSAAQPLPLEKSLSGRVYSIGDRTDSERSLGERARLRKHRGGNFLKLVYKVLGYEEPVPIERVGSNGKPPMKKFNSAINFNKRGNPLP